MHLCVKNFARACVPVGIAMIPPVRVPEYTAFSACCEGESEAIRAQVPKVGIARQFQDQVRAGKCMAPCAFPVIYRLTDRRAEIG